MAQARSSLPAGSRPDAPASGRGTARSSPKRRLTGTRRKREEGWIAEKTEKTDRVGQHIHLRPNLREIAGRVKQHHVAVRGEREA